MYIGRPQRPVSAENRAMTYYQHGLASTAPADTMYERAPEMHAYVLRAALPTSLAAKTK